MQSKYVRIAGIILAILLGAAALLYLGGLVSQVYLGYHRQRHHDARSLFTLGVLAQRPDHKRPDMHTLFGGAGRRPVSLSPTPGSLQKQGL